MAQKFVVALSCVCVLCYLLLGLTAQLITVMMIWEITCGEIDVIKTEADVKVISPQR